METFIDIDNNIIRYNDEEVIIIIDKSGEPWFRAVDIANILKYHNTRQAILDRVHEDDKISYKELRRHKMRRRKDIQNTTLFINESWSIFSYIA